MDELHENRTEFVWEVRETRSDALKRYGLELGSVLLTALDQTPFASLDENCQEQSKAKAEAERDRLLALASAKEVDVIAHNAKPSETVHAELEQMRLAAVPQIISETVKPAEKIKVLISIR